MIRALLTTLALLLPAANAADPPHHYTAPWLDTRPKPRGPELLNATMMKAHNDARRAYGMVPLAWDYRLAADARTYARKMARTRKFRHDSSPERRRAQGENIWMGTRNGFSYATMIGQIIDERRDFRPGIFPAVSRTGRWTDVGHFTQVIWPTTTHVGCAIASNASDEYLVCRYAPRGNISGVLLR